MSEVARQAYRTAEASSVRIPYIGMALVLSCLAIGLALIKLKPQESTANLTQDFRPSAFADSPNTDSIWRHPGC